MTWTAQLEIDYHHDGTRTVAHHRHQGPLRVLKSLYPEGEHICHSVMIHPPSGLVSGDLLDIRVNVASGAHGLLTTPGATRFYRSNGLPATQQTQLHLAPGARLEWLPLETLCYSGCDARNTLTLSLEPGAQLIAWDLVALGLPGAQLGFEAGQLHQRIVWPGLWLEEARINAKDTLLLNGASGMAGFRCLGTLWLACGDSLAREQREHLLETTEALCQAHRQSRLQAGATAPNSQLVVLRVLSDFAEPAHALMRAAWLHWRHSLWQLDAAPPRIWAM